LLAADARTREFFHPEAVAALVREHADQHFDHSYRLWALLMLELWMREWV
jgi:asparagine synthase (glutamine-hydrolysing)